MLTSSSISCLFNKEHFEESVRSGSPASTDVIDDCDFNDIVLEICDFWQLRSEIFGNGNVLSTAFHGTSERKKEYDMNWHSWVKSAFRNEITSSSRQNIVKIKCCVFFDQSAESTSKVPCKYGYQEAWLRGSACISIARLLNKLKSVCLTARVKAFVSTLEPPEGLLFTSGFVCLKFIREARVRRERAGCGREAVC